MFTSHFKKYITSFIFPIILGLIIALFLRTYVIQTNLVSGPSMIPSFQNKDYLITDKLSYHFTAPKHGDVVIVKLENENKYIIKRVIGTPGDVLDFVAPNEKNGYTPQFFINGKLQKEDYIKEQMDIKLDSSYKVNKNEIFAMGDNRNQSSDSRVYGKFPYESVKGKVVLELRDKFQFHTNPTPYVLVFSFAVLLILIYLFFPFLNKLFKRK
ncbi:signal peptidase I [Bacillus thuringiensis]|uniref:Signal peptidase I n=1 Tax=Bacillus thuringiensis TaxID=1428 RepID=A0A9X6ZQ28_BACTU|nr:signal peptidase I [Bacillus thuringiensis]